MSLISSSTTLAFNYGLKTTACHVAHSVERWTSNLKLTADAGSGIDCVKKCLHYMLHNNTLLKFRIKVFFGAPTP